jgi:N-acetylglucosaminyldiphosphoundecaprenol N-acetyl-beta-D-mannosaminyltransferase
MSDKTSLFGMQLDPLRLSQAVRQVMAWIEQGERRCHYVVTPNVDHAVMFQENSNLRDAYRNASLVLADGAPLVWAARWLKRIVPERVAGSDLTPAVFAAARKRRPLRAFLLGAAPGVARRAAERIEARWSGVQVVGTYSPPLGFEKDDSENDKIISLVNDAAADLLVLGLGAPKQELWIQRHVPRLKVSVALCVGATIDFLAGERARAPKLMQRIGLEWLHRVASEPRRLLKRYAHDAWIFPQLVWREWRTG